MLPVIFIVYISLLLWVNH